MALSLQYFQVAKEIEEIYKGHCGRSVDLLKPGRKMEDA